MQQMLWMCAREIFWTAQYRIKSDWTCDTGSAPSSQQSPSPPLSPDPPTEQISGDSTFNVIQLNANGNHGPKDRPDQAVENH